MDKILIYTDGGARGNPGPAGIGVVFTDENNQIIAKYNKYIGSTTNNVAEYQALIYALEKLKDFNFKEVECRLDSELVVKQLNGDFKVKDKNLKKLYEQARELTFFKPITFRHIYREKNKHADRLVNEAIDKAIKLEISTQ